MPKPRKNEKILCPHFVWRLSCRHDVWYADGRSNTPDAGRHSLGTFDHEEALRLLPQLDQARAEALGLAAPSTQAATATKPLLLAEGRQLYEDYVTRPRVTGGVRGSTAKRYRSAFDKFLRFAASKGVTVWNGVTAELLNAYAAHMETQGYAYKTQVNELVILKQAVKWFVRAGHLVGAKVIDLPLRKAESERAYCYRTEEVRAMLDHCRTRPELGWLGSVIVALACTGLRISELVSLRWSDVDLEAGRIRLTDESARIVAPGRKRRELKSGRSRSFPIHPDLQAVLDQLPRTDAYVFHGPRGGRLRRETVRSDLVQEVIRPLAKRFPSLNEEKGFEDGRLHSFRHYFCSTCANNGVPERMVMEWLGHQDSAMVRHYYHLHDDEARRRMAALDFLGEAGGRSADDTE